jgi:hypothetical protein
MATSAETPIVAQEQNTTSNSLQEPVNIDSSVEQPVSTTPPQTIGKPGFVSSARSYKLRFIGACVLTAIAALGWLTLISNPGQQPAFLTSIVLIAAAGFTVLTEVVVAWIIRPRRHSPFDILPLVGTALFIAASIVALVGVSEGRGEISALLAIAPTLAAAVVCLGSGFSLLGISSARRDADYLYPSTLKLAESLKLGDKIKLSKGDIVPADGRIESGSIGLDERAYTTVPTFRIRDEQELVYAGSQVIAGSAELTVLNAPSDSCLSQLQQVLAPMASEAEEGLEREDSRATRWSAMTIMFLAIAAAISWNERSPGYVQALSAAGMVALFAGVCQVGQLLYGQRRALVRRWIERGFVLSGASACADLAKVRGVECDASRCGDGSLARVLELEILDDRLSAEALCDFLASLLGRAEDPFLVVTGEHCRRNAAKISLERVLELREYPGRGICGVVHGVELSVGSEDFLVERGIMVQPNDGSSQVASNERLILVAINDDVVARFRVTSEQGDVVPSDGQAMWSSGVTSSMSSGAARELGEEILLVRGRESDLVGVTARNDLNLFNIEEGTVRRGTVIALTPELAPIDRLLKDCKNSVKAVERSRLLVAFGGLLVVVASFAGFISPVIPLLLTLIVGFSAQRGYSPVGMN